jgi:hypothetical protein
LEFFTHGKNVEILKKILPQYPQLNYHIINKNVSLLDTYNMYMYAVVVINEDSPTHAYPAAKIEIL